MKLSVYQAEIAEVTGADVTMLADAIGHDVRIGRRFVGEGRIGLDASAWRAAGWTYFVGMGRP